MDQCTINKSHHNLPEMTYEACSKWVDIDSCGSSNTYSSANITTSCSELIESDRVGHCLCHNEEVSIWKRCDHEPFTCDDICAEATVGCRDPSSQLAVWYSNQDGANLIVGCDGRWDKPGVRAASQALCDHENGFEICSDLDQLRRLKLGLYDCSHTADPNTIYITDIGSDSLLFGCGNDGEFDEIPVIRNNKVWPFRLALDLDTYGHSRHTEDSWKVDLDTFAETERGIRNAVYKVKESGGGVLCCKTTGLDPEHGVDDVLQILLEMMAFVLVFFLFSMCIFKTIQCVFQCLGSRLVWCRGRCRFRFNGVINLCGRWRIPITWRGWEIWKRQRDIDRIKCKKFKEYANGMIEGTENGEIISDDSAVCVICFDRYEAESMVIHLRCGHHFHKTCGLPWLQEHEQCPVCRQFFKTAEDRHAYGNEVEMKEIGLQSDINNIATNVNGS